MEQTFSPFRVSPDTWHDPQRNVDLALIDGACLNCFSVVGWQNYYYGEKIREWTDYWVIDEDMETVYCESCYQELTKEIE